jgi:SAM-dependent methyltransferase
MIPPAPRCAVDLGIGLGNAMALVDGDPALRVGLDYNAGMIRLAAEQLPNVSLIQTDVRHLPLRADSVDLVLCVGLSEYLADIEALVKDIGDVLVPGGHAVFTISHRNSLTWLRMLFGHRIYPRSRDEIEDAFGANQLSVIKRIHSQLQHQYLIRKDEQ